MDDFEIARALFGTKATGRKAGNASQTTTAIGIATGASKDGKVAMNFGGDTVSPEDDQSVEVATTFQVNEGDQAIVSMIGATGTGKQPIVTGVIGKGDQTADDIKEAMTEAKKAAQVSQHFLYNTEGAFVTTQETDGSTSPTASYNRMTADGMEIVNSNEKSVASFGASTRIGEMDNSHILIDSNTMQLYDKDGHPYFSVGDLRASDGFVHVSEKLTGKGTVTRFSLKFAVSTLTISGIYRVTINGAVQDPSTYSLLSSGFYWEIEFTTAPASGAAIIAEILISSVYYQSTNGTRKTGSTIGINSFSEGVRVESSGYDGCHAEGFETVSSGRSSHSEGQWSTSSGLGSHSEGSATASGEVAHAEGHGFANGAYSHAEGHATYANGSYSHAEGNCNTASGNGSHAEGDNTFASSDNQHVFGRLNIEDSNSQFVEIVGNGLANYDGSVIYRSNARTLDWYGNMCLAGADNGILRSTFCFNSQMWKVRPNALNSVIYLKLTKSMWPNPFCPIKITLWANGKSTAVTNLPNNNYFYYVYYELLKTYRAQYDWTTSGKFTFDSAPTAVNQILRDVHSSDSGGAYYPVSVDLVFETAGGVKTTGAPSRASGNASIDISNVYLMIKNIKNSYGFNFQVMVEKFDINHYWADSGPLSELNPMTFYYENPSAWTIADSKDDTTDNNYYRWPGIV